MAAGRDRAPEAGEALAQLCELYWPPLYSFARRRGYSVEEAQDLTQGFFARLLEKHDVQAADPLRGRFRSFLLSAFTHFLTNAYDHDQAAKRGGGRVVSLEGEMAEAYYAAEPADTLTPEALYERQWARGVIDRAQAALRDELAAAGRARLFELVKDLLLGERADGGYANVAHSLSMTEGATKVTVHRLRRRLRELLRVEIRQTVSDDSEVEEEVRYLMTVLTN